VPAVCIISLESAFPSLELTGGSESETATRSDGVLVAAVGDIAESLTRSREIRTEFGEFPEYSRRRGTDLDHQNTGRRSDRDEIAMVTPDRTRTPWMVGERHHGYDFRR
jgi:hypothetical protein